MTLLLHPASAGAARQSIAETAAAAIRRERLTTETLLGIAFLNRDGVRCNNSTWRSPYCFLG
jgi:hypothetical protein